MYRWISAAAVVAVALLSFQTQARAHCQIPCGIYHDHMRVEMIREDITTITKAVRQIGALASKRDAQSQNQLTRWIVNKEEHAERIIRVISDYFMAQKIKPVGTKDKGFARYQAMLTRHHAVMVAAMKCKQNASMKEVNALKKAVDAIAGYWKK